MQKPSHQSITVVNCAAYFNTKDSERNHIALLIDEVAEGDPAKLEKIRMIIEWAKEEGACEEAYNNTDFSGE